MNEMASDLFKKDKPVHHRSTYTQNLSHFNWEWRWSIFRTQGLLAMSKVGTKDESKLKKDNTQ